MLTIPRNIRKYPKDANIGSVKKAVTKRWFVSTTKYKHGIKTNVIVDAKRMPKLSDRAMGITNCAWRLVSNSTGNSPTKVVSVVSRIALKRCAPAVTIAS